MVGLDGWEGVRFGVEASRFGLRPSKISDFEVSRWPILDPPKGMGIFAPFLFEKECARAAI